MLNGTNLDAEMGPIVTATWRASIEGYIGIGVQKARQLLVDGRGHGARCRAC
jgi:malonate-semialdehyde dehydrogenase (acetylating) / methylmalonate-semialdehyde dehydrogenase